MDGPLFLGFVKDSWGNSEANQYIMFDFMFKHKGEFPAPKRPSVLLGRTNTLVASEGVVTVQNRVCSVLLQSPC